MASETGKPQINTNDGLLRVEYGNNRIIVNDGSNDRLLVGKDNNGDIKIKLSQTNNDVKTATDDNLIWSSDFNTFKIVQKGTGIVVGSDNSGSSLWTLSNTTTINHNLGYRPVHLVYVDIDLGSGFRRLTPTSYDWNASINGGNFPWESYIISDVTDSVLNIRFYTAGLSNTSATTAHFTYYLLRETAT